MSKPSPIDALCERWHKHAENGRKLSHEHPDLIENTAVWALEACSDELSRLAPLVATVVEAFREKSKLLHRTMAYRSSTSPHAGITFEDCTEVECVTARAALKAYEEGA